MTVQPTVSPEDVGLSSERLGRIPTFFDAGYLATERLPCMATLVARDGEIAHLSTAGVLDRKSGTPIGADTIYRIYSMTKPITSVAAMMCVEDGSLRLDHEVSRYIPAFKDVRVWIGGTPEAPITKEPDRPMLVRDLFLHTSGLTYDFLFQHPVEELYRKTKVVRANHDLETFADILAGIPLIFSPGERWNYSVGVDLLGRLIEIASGQSLDDFFRTRIFEPLGMTDTGFTVPASKTDRFAACYQRNPLDGEISMADKGDASSAYVREGKDPTRLFSGGGGLCSTIGDYFRFCMMIRNGGELDGNRLLSPKTLEFMRQNHLPGGKSIRQMGDKTFSEARMDGNGFGLGWSITTDTVETMQPGSVGTIAWGGLASTFFWIDPEEDIIAIQMTQMIPSSAYPIRPQFQSLVYASIVG